MAALFCGADAVEQFHRLKVGARKALVDNFKILDRRFLPT